MTFYRKRPLQIEAFRWTGGPDQTEDPFWIIEAMKNKSVAIRDAQEQPDGIFCMMIETPEGTMVALPGDYIIKGVKGEIYPCKADIFMETYEEVEEIANIY